MSKFNRMAWPVAIPAAAALSMFGLVATSSAASAVGSETDPLAGESWQRPAPETVPYFGVYVKLTRDGVYVRGVVTDGPADLAGIQSGDKIVSVNGVSFDHRGAFREAIDGVTPGDVIPVVYERDGVQTSVRVETGSQADRPTLEERPWLGAFPAAPDGDTTTGLTIGYVSDGSPADVAGVQVGDEVVSVNGVDVTNPRDAFGSLRTMSPGDTLVLGLQRGGDTLTVAVVLGSQADNPNREADLAARQQLHQDRQNARHDRREARHDARNADAGGNGGPGGANGWGTSPGRFGQGGAAA